MIGKILGKIAWGLSEKKGLIRFLVRVDSIDDRLMNLDNYMEDFAQGYNNDLEKFDKELTEIENKILDIQERINIIITDMFDNDDKVLLDNNLLANLMLK